MSSRLEVAYLSHVDDVEGDTLRKKFNLYLGLNLKEVKFHKIYKIKTGFSLKQEDLERLKEDFTDPVMEYSSFAAVAEPGFDFVLLVGFRPGVTDNVGRTARVAISEILGCPASRIKAYSQKAYFFKKDEISRTVLEKGAKELAANELIETIKIVNGDEYENEAVSVEIPEIVSSHAPATQVIGLEGSDEDLMRISKERVLSLTLTEMKAIQSYYSSKETMAVREKAGLPLWPTDTELEALAQTWSEHCKHKIFNARIEYEENGEKKTIHSLFNDYIKRSTKELEEEVDHLVSVFHDNAGVIRFNDRHHLVYKVETHNSPSALDPYGGAMTGIVGVNRDPMGTGLGAELLINTWGYCFGNPDYDKETPKGMLHPRRIREGVHQGVIDGGNHSGIPYGRGWELFDDRFMGKPLVFCGTAGLLPVKVGERPGEEKKINVGDYIVMIGGRIGKDGIHGATFSSEELHEESPSQAVQIGDPITQKMMSDFIKEARDADLYSAITDNGAGGLSSSVGEMAEMTNGCKLDLALAPLKYQGLDPWEILISEAQERMTLAAPGDKLEDLKKLARKREVELTVLGEFTDDGFFHVLYNEETVAYLSMDFLHDGLPKMELKAKWIKKEEKEVDFPPYLELNSFVDAFLKRMNLSSKEDDYRHYDHEVKGLSVLKPFLGKENNIPAEATVFLAELSSWEGIVFSEGINPFLSDIDTYDMCAWIMDLAYRRVLSVGGTVRYLAGLDNFCWPDPVQSAKTPDGEYKLAQLVKANQALYDYTKAFKIPLISGKDSMKNDTFLGGEKISIPPTLLFSMIGKVDDVRKLRTLEPRESGDLIYIVGNTEAVLGGSEFALARKDPLFDRRSVPIDAENASRFYDVVKKINEEDILASAAAPGRGGLFFSLFSMAAAARKGIFVDLSHLPSSGELNLFHAWFAESPLRMVLTVSPEKEEALLKLVSGLPYAKIGTVTDNHQLEIKWNEIVYSKDIESLSAVWKG